MEEQRRPRWRAAGVPREQVVWRHGDGFVTPSGRALPGVAELHDRRTKVEAGLGESNEQMTLGADRTAFRAVERGPAARVCFARPPGLRSHEATRMVFQ